MSELNKKYLIAVLLLGACMTSIFLLFSLSGEPTKRLTGIAQADSLIRKDLNTFNISEQQFSNRSVSLGDSAERLEYVVRVPRGFSKTHLHQEIHDTFHHFGVSSPARVIFPDKDFQIHLLVSNTVFATIKVVTDEDLAMARSFGSVLIAFEDLPAIKNIQQVRDMDPSLRVVLKIEEPDQAEEYLNDSDFSSKDFIFWLEQDEDVNQNTYSESYLPRIIQLSKAAPQADLLSFRDLQNHTSATFDKTFSGTSMNYIDVSDAIVLHAELGKTAFQRELQKFIRQAQQGQYPIAVVMASERTLEWLPQELAEFKKSGLSIVPPKKNRLYND